MQNTFMPSNVLTHSNINSIKSKVQSFTEISLTLDMIETQSTITMSQNSFPAVNL